MAAMKARIYALWFFAAALVGAIGSASDVSWHFSRLFDEVSPPHLIAAGGFLINLALIYWALIHEHVTGVERTGWRLNALGAAVFVFAIPLDYLWHLLFGLDNTVWSPPHLLLFYSAAPITLGVLLAWLTRPTSSTRLGQALTFGICALFMSNTLFPLSQQDYAAVVTKTLARTGRMPWYVTPELWAVAGGQAQRLAEGHAPDWAYLVGSAALLGVSLGCGALILRTQWQAELRWLAACSATLLALIVLLFRLLMRGALSMLALPYASITWWLVAAGAAIDLTCLLMARIAPIATPRRKGEFWRPLSSVAEGVLLACTLSITINLAHLIGQPAPLAPLEALPAALIVGAAGVLVGEAIARAILGAARPREEVTYALTPFHLPVTETPSFDTL
jgi:hypothetical protein